MSSSGSGGFWKRVGAFVKNPTRDWSLTDEQALQEHENLEKLRAREDQKRQDDFIRKRELDALRRLRKREITDIPIDDSLQTNIPDTAPPDAAAVRDATLRKINEIEQSMVRESVLPGGGRAAFRASRTGNASTNFATTAPLTSIPKALAPDSGAPNSVSTSAPSSGRPEDSQPHPLELPDTDLQNTLPMPKADTLPPDNPPSVLEFDPNLLAPTQPATDDQLTLAAATRINEDTEPALNTSGSDGWLRGSNDFMPSAYFAIEVHDVLGSNPLFDQAVMDFANGDDTAAETSLREAISDCAEKDAEKELWLALFDLFRASRQTGKFEALVVDFVSRFQTSAPMLDDLPATPGGSEAPKAAGHRSTITFSNPLDMPQANRLSKLLAGAPAALELDFTNVSTIQADTLAEMARIWHELNATACSLKIRGTTELLALCAAQAQPMQGDADANWWALRLEVLRLLGDQDTFDAAALDYCVTYEISPPTWEQTKVKLDREGSDVPAPGPSAGQNAASGPPSTLGPGSTRSAQLQLSGEILGSTNTFLAGLDQAAKVHDQLSISLRNLQRIDFSSAGALLNWAMLQRGNGKTIQLTGVHRLIAGLFSILGLHEHLLIQLRRD